MTLNWSPIGADDSPQSSTCIDVQHVPRLWVGDALSDARL